MRQEAQNRRDNAISMAMKRKEEYLGARVPKELRDRVINQAKKLEIPVSILIRNILEEAFKGGSSDAEVDMSAVSQRVEEKQNDKFSSVLGWEKMKLNRHIACSSCNTELHPGATVALGIGAKEPVVLCADCESRM